MNRKAIIALVFGLVGITAFAQGPDERGSVLKAPSFDAPPAPQPTPRPAAAPKATSSATPDYLRLFAPDAVPAEPADPNARRGFALKEIPDINKDLQVTPAAGQWLIMVISYPGEDGPMKARKMCLELRQTNRVPAFVFMYGAEERKKEYDRVKKIIDDQQQFFKEQGTTPDQPLRLRHKQVDVHSAVLIGGYPDDAAAQAAVERVHKWAQPNEKKVDLEIKYYHEIEGKDATKIKKTEAFYVNPFKRAFAVRNPSIKQEAPQEAKIDIAVLKRMNSDEPYSLLNCKKPYTLAVKEFQTPFMMQDRDTPTGIWEKIVPFTKTGHPDTAKISAHNLAETLSKLKYEAYALHTKFSSTVTVGGFDSPDDPQLKAMQDNLAARFSQPGYALVQFFHRPVPMAVPK